MMKLFLREPLDTWLIKLFFKWGRRFCIFAFLCLLAEFVFFYSVLTKNREVHNTGLIAVFSGSAGRIDKGYDLANAGIAPLLCISPRNSKQYRSDTKKYKIRNNIHYAIEQRAKTTFQNAWLVGAIVKKRGIQSVALVTDLYHMPRSLLLLQMALANQPAEILPVPVETSAYSKNPLKWTVVQKKQVYNEMLELWGSLFELAQYTIRGGMPERSLKKNKFIGALRGLLLLKVK